MPLAVKDCRVQFGISLACCGLGSGKTADKGRGIGDLKGILGIGVSKVGALFYPDVAID